jgi:WD40 repeat protein
LATAYGYGGIRIWDVISLKEVVTLRGHRANVNAIKYSADGRWLASGGVDGVIKMWDTGSWQEKGSLHGHANSVASLAFTMDGQQLASSCVDSTIKVGISFILGINDAARPFAKVHQVVFLPDGRLASAGDDATLRIWNVPRSAKSVTFAQETVIGRFSPDSRLIVKTSADEPKNRRLWRADTEELVAGLGSSTSSVWAVAFSPDSRLVATADDDASLRLWETGGGRLRAVLPTGTNSALSVAFSRQGHLFAAVANEDFIRRWDVVNMRELSRLSGLECEARRLEISPDNGLLAAWCPDGNVRLIDLKTLEALTPIPHRSDSPDMEISPDGTLLLLPRWDRGTELWDMRATKRLKIFDEVVWPAFSPDGRLLALPWRTHPLRIDLWDIRKQRTVARLASNAGWAGTVAFSPDGRTLVSSDSWVTLRFWSMTALREVLTLVPKAGGNAGFHPMATRCSWSTTNGKTCCCTCLALMRSTPKSHPKTSPRRRQSNAPLTGIKEEIQERNSVNRTKFEFQDIGCCRKSLVGVVSWLIWPKEPIRRGLP